jgi:hypothetical protein
MRVSTVQNRSVERFVVVVDSISLKRLWPLRCTMSFYIRVVFTYGQGAVHVLLAMRHQGMMVRCMMLLFGTYGQVNKGGLVQDSSLNKDF